MSSLFKHLRFTGKTPRAAIRILDGVIRTRLLGQNRLRNCQLALTHACNQSCSICSSSALRREAAELTLEQWCRVADEAKQMGCVHFDLTGGEPVMKGLDFLEKLISRVNEKRDRIVSLATNGSLLDGNTLEKLKKAGLNSVLFNLQSADAREHDRICGVAGSFDKIKELIPLAVKAGLNVCANTCLGNYNIGEIEKLTDWCEKRDIFILLNPAAPSGNFAGRDVGLKEFRERYYAILDSHPLARADTSYNFRGRNLCPGGIEKLYITAYGDVLQCTFCQVSFGNILNEPLKNIHERFSAHPLIRQKSICKHSFNEEFRKLWLDPIAGFDKLPVPLKDHPNYRLFTDCNTDRRLF